MELLDDARMYVRFATGLRAFLRTPITLHEARASAEQRLAERADNFLRMLERGIYGNPASPFLKLLTHAKCEFGDVQALVRTRGIETTLRNLHEAGVYVTFEEFKGRQPIVRGELEMQTQPRAFDNPFLKHYYYGETGGSTGAGTRVAIDLDFLRAQTPHLLLTAAAHDVIGAPRVLWLGVFPDSSGINNILRLAPARQPATRWFAPLTPDQVRTSGRDTISLPLIIRLARWNGFPIPEPEFVAMDEPLVIAQCIHALVQEHGACIVSTHVSKALRICLCARENNLDFTGVVFWGGGEPPTPAKVKQIRESGARFLPGYWITELGSVAMGCANPVDENDLHLFEDDHALITCSRQVPNTQLEVDAFHFTSLNFAASKLMLNVESDDYGIVETRDCGCALGEAGFHTHLREIHSFRKLTGEGATLVGSDMVRILEQVLPARYGGSPLDYQLVEQEDERGITRLNLLISTRVPIQDEAQVIQTVLEELQKTTGDADYARAMWKQAQSLRIQRREPIWTGRGKLMPLHLERRARLKE